MSLLLDHIFILTDPGAPVADRIAELGLTEGSDNQHPGQGTANRRFFFNNTTLELIYIDDEQECIDGPGRDLDFPGRYQQTVASRFGLVARLPTAGTTPTFSYWPYFPQYFPDGTHFLVGKNSSNPVEPLCICMPPNLFNGANKVAQAEALLQKEPVNTGWQLTSLQLTLPVTSVSDTLAAFAHSKPVSLEFGDEHHLKLGFNDRRENQSRCFAPEIPLTIEY